MEPKMFGLSEGRIPRLEGTPKLEQYIHRLEKGTPKPKNI